MKRPHIVILGAGYGGMMTTVKLQKILQVNEAKITLINKHDYHYQTTWLHETAAGTIDSEQARISIQDIININQVNFVKDTVIRIDPEKKLVLLEHGEVIYDILVIGLGFEANTYGIPGLHEHAFTISSFNRARILREHLTYNFAKYHNELEKNPARLNIVVVGGGFTGVELLGELANRIPELCNEYDINKAKVRIINIEATSTILPGFDSRLVNYAMTSLESRGVELITNAQLEECKENSIVYTKNDESIELPTMTTIWAAGIQANSVIKDSGFRTVHGKIEVEHDLRSVDHDDIFVLGDCAYMKNTKTNEPFPSTAQIAVQSASTVATNIQALMNGNKKLKKFIPHLQGTVASLGHCDGIGVVFDNYKLYGWKAVFMKKLVDNRYLLKLGGLRLLMKNGKFNVFY